MFNNVPTCKKKKSKSLPHSVLDYMHVRKYAINTHYEIRRRKGKYKIR